MGPSPPLRFVRRSFFTLLVVLVLLQLFVFADWVDDVIEIVNQKMAPWHALLEKYERALATMESEERELSRIKQIIEKKIEMHQKKLKKLMLKVVGNATFECKFR
ncbi:hypothetical protein niasHT_005799 [Heterodera trifolii]|uniref:Transmembrane protein n=1 Tax=Heterodera trifolii TaxID=157864 RepID=A0ABD2LWE7_9BILA